MQGEDALLQQALEAAVAIRDQGCRARAHSAVAAQLQGETRRTALQQALEAAAAIQDEESHSLALSAVAAHLQGEPKRTALPGAMAHRHLRTRDAALAFMAEVKQMLSPAQDLPRHAEISLFWRRQRSDLRSA
jgi:hypothetical protein